MEEMSPSVLETSRAARLEEIEQTFDFLRRDSEVAHVLLGFSAALAEVKSLQETLDLAVRMLPTIFSADSAWAVAWNGHTFDLVAHEHLTVDQERSLAASAATEGGLPALYDVMVKRNPALIEDAGAVAPLGEQPGPASLIAIPLALRDEDFGALVVSYDSERQLDPRDLTLARGIARQVAVALANARQFSLLQSLRRYALRIASKLRLEEVLAQIAEGATELVDADAAGLYFLDSDRKSLVRATTVGPRAEIAEPFRRFEIDPGDFSALLGETPVHIATLGTGDQPVTAVAAAVPSPGADLLGAAVVFYGWDKKVGSDQVEALSVLAAHSGMAVDNAQRFERQRRVARSLQKGLLLTDRPEMDHYDIATIYEPASMDSDIGGDFFDVFQLPGERFGVVVGDVSGKGAEAAAQTAMAKYMLRAFALRATGPASVLYHLNNALARGLSEDRFATLFYAIFDPDGSHCVLSSGGHPPPLLYRAATKTVESLPIEGPLIGAFESQQFEQRSFELALGDVLVGYTDGLLDVRGPDGMYGRRRTEESLARNADKPIEELVKAMQADAHAFGRAADDMVIFGLKTKR